jgi:hypothetical protein
MSCHQAMKQVKLLLFSFQSVLQLEALDPDARTDYCHWFCGIVHEEVYVLDSLWMNHGSTLGDTLIVKTVEYGVLKTPWHCIKIVCIYQTLVFGMQYLENEIVRQLFFEETVAAESYENHVTQFIALLEEMNGIAGFSIVGRLPVLQTQQWLACKTPLVTALADMTFGHHGA